MIRTKPKDESFGLKHWTYCFKEKTLCKANNNLAKQLKQNRHE